MAKKRVIKKKKVAKKKTTKKIVTPKDAPSLRGLPGILKEDCPPMPSVKPPKPDVSEPVIEQTVIHIEIKIPEPELTPEPVNVNCVKCSTLTKSTVACVKCSALMCITCAGHSPCPRCGV